MYSLRRFSLSLLLPFLMLGADGRLFEAVQNGDQRTVLNLVKAGVNINSARPDGSTALGWAVSRGNLEIASALLQAGANPNLADENGETPLTLACGQGNVAMARLLLAAKAKVDAARWRVPCRMAMPNS